MSAVLRPIKWFYHEFGVDSVHQAGRDAFAIILARSLRMFAYGTNSLVLAIFFSKLNFSDFQIGLFMTLTLLGDVLLGTLLTLVADRLGRRKVLILGSCLMMVSGIVFALLENFWLLLFAAVVGVISATGGDFGPFRSVEESILAQLTTPHTRADVLAWYVTISGLGSAIGSEASGRMIHYLESRDGWDAKDAYHALFWLYTLMGVINAILSFSLGQACELQETTSYSRVGQEDEEVSDRDSTALDRQDDPTTHQVPTAPEPKAWWSRMASNLSRISAPTRSVMYKLWFLLAIDSISDGMVPYSLTNYYIDEKHHPTKSLLGDIQSAAYFLGAVSGVFAGPLARRIGLINTMVFTHVPSSAAVLFFPLPRSMFGTAVLLLIRAGLNPMDQAPRSAFISAVVKPEERTAVMGITAMVRTLAAMLGPSITGVLAGSNRFWIAFVAGGALRLAYDLGLYVMFRSMKLEEAAEENDGTKRQNNHGHDDDDDDETELGQLPRRAVTTSHEAIGRGSDESWDASSEHLRDAR